MVADYKKVKEAMDKISPTYCAAKWLNSTIWLYCGESASCHHVQGDMICLSDLTKDNSCLHNTSKKIIARQEMLAGKMPKECNYCWAIEKTSNYAGDRLYKTAEFSEEDIEKTLSNTSTVFPKYLEIAFDNICNFACCYCTPKYSTRWKALSNDKVDYTSNKSIYVHYFWKWLPTLMQNKATLRITGGEPLMHSEFWKLVDIYEKEKIESPLLVNTNLGSPDALISLLIEKSRNIKDVAIHTSCEAVGDRAEYIRDGLDFERFESNILKVIQSGVFKDVNITATLTNLSVCYYTDFLNWVLFLKKKNNGVPTVTTNILHHPAQMGVRVLPPELKAEAISNLEKWMEDNKGNAYFNEVELETLDKLIQYMKEGPQVSEDLLKKCQTFFKEYDLVRGKSLSIFPKMVGWEQLICAEII